MRVTVIDDEERMGAVVARRLAAGGYEARAYTSAEAALAEAASFLPEVIVTDLKMPGLSGLDVLERTRRTFPNTEVVLMTAHGSVQTAVDAMKKGAYDYLTKPFPLEELELLLEKIRERATLRRENEVLRETLAGRARFENIIAISAEMQAVLDRVRRVAASDAPVLIRGESGTGKEVVATAIHAASRRATGPLIKVNCGALSETLLESELFGHTKGSFTGAHQDRRGFFEAANGGTLFLDEIGEVSAALQVKLLRVLQDGTFSRVGSSDNLTADVRILAATNRDLEAAVEEGAFRQDLYYRLNVVPIELPPLRNRREDIGPLVDFFRGRARVGDDARRRHFAPEAMDLFVRYGWPGNIRELQNAVEYAMVMSRGEVIGPDDLPAAIGAASRSRNAGAGDLRSAIDGVTLESLERTALMHALNQEDWNHTRAAKRLGITRRTLGYRMQKFDIPSKPNEPAPSALRARGIPPIIDTPPEESGDAAEVRGGHNGAA